jgi:hypothetical protein
MPKVTSLPDLASSVPRSTAAWYSARPFIRWSLGTTKATSPGGSIMQARAMAGAVLRPTGSTIDA